MTSTKLKQHEHKYLQRPLRIALIGMGYVGLPTALALHSSGASVIGFDLSTKRLDAIRSQIAELIPEDQDRLARALSGAPERFILTNEPSILSEADAIIIAVPTPINADHSPDLEPLKSACNTVLAHAVAGQTIILTSTTYVGCTKDLLVTPLIEAGFKPGEDIHVAFAPERIDPGNTTTPQSATPRVLGAATPESHEHAWQVLRLCAPHIHSVSSMEAAEFAKLVENTFRAVNIAWINEMADAAKELNLDIAEVIDAAATKPFGYTKFTPGAGVGGHCIPCDPHYLLGVLPDHSAPITALSMQAIHARPNKVSDSALATLTAAGIAHEDANVVIAGVAYKPDVQDLRESPALDIMASLISAGVNVSFYDPLVDSLHIASETLTSIDQSEIGNADLVIWHTAHQSMAPHRVLTDAVRILDTTYRLDLADPRVFRI